MHPAKLKSVGGSVMVAIPPHVREQLKLAAGSDVWLSVEDGRLVLQSPRRLSRIGLEARLAMCDPLIPRSQDDAEWDSMPSSGREVLEPYDPVELAKLEKIADKNERRAKKG